jgi:hypothetical protein
VLSRLRGVRRSLARAVTRRRASGGAGPDVRELGERVRAAQEELARLDARKAELVELRRGLLRTLGTRAGRASMPLDRVERSNGVPSFLAGVRMVQRIHRRAENPAHGLDGAGAFFADRERTEQFARAHGVPLSTGADDGPDDRTVVVHAFHGDVGLVEVRAGAATRHVDGQGADPGDVRTGVTYDPELTLPASLPDLTAWSATLSAHVCRPYVQVRWHQDGDRLVLGGVDVDPERVPVLAPHEDVRLGRLFDAGHARMLLQPYLLGALQNRVPGGVFDPREALDLHEPVSPSRSVHPSEAP